MKFHLANSKSRDAEVALESARAQEQIRWVDASGAGVENRRLLRSTTEHDIEALAGKLGGIDAVAQALIDGDPEVDIEAFGEYLEDVSRVYVNSDGEICHSVARTEVLFTPDGTEKERRPQATSEANVAAELPVKWTGKKMKRADVLRRFVFANKMQIRHVNGLTYDFLYAMAKELEEADSMMLLGGGGKGAEPLVLRAGGLGYRGFLEGRTDGDRYLLVLHLSNQELKAPAPPEEKGGDA